jgi:hypothetical protein
MDKKYRTADGLEVRIYATDGDNISAVHGAIKLKEVKNQYYSKPEYWDPATWNEKGECIDWEGDRWPDHDLVEIKQTHIVWVRFQKNNNSDVYVDFISKERPAVGAGTFAIKQITVTEGEGLSDE